MHGKVLDPLTGEKDHIVRVYPKEALTYMRNYNYQWRGGNRAGSINNVEIERALEFIETYFDILSTTHRNVYLRGQLKAMIRNLEEDIKVDNIDHKVRIRDILCRDPSLMDEDYQNNLRE